MSGRNCDIAIIGGGLAGGLIALALARQRPEMAVRLFEAGRAAGGNHRWSWFATDLPPGGTRLLQEFRTARWDDGYEVRFPGIARRLPTAYRSLQSHDFAQGLARQLAPGTLLAGTAVASLDGGGVVLSDGARINARAVIDCRGFAPTPHLTGGWQIFTGRHLRTPVQHGLERPVIMDATVDQIGGYRFVYLLPLGDCDLFIEDTYYQDSPTLDREALSARIDAYCTARGWQGKEIASETGVLPVVTGGDFSAFQNAQRTDGVAVAGARGGFSHPLTSYTLPFAVRTALAIAAHADLPGEDMAAMMEARARDHWRDTRFYRGLGAMLFGAARPEERRRIFARFYGLEAPLIERFYAGRSTRMDKARVLCGRPPVPVHRAIGALAGKQPALMEAA